MELTVFDLGVLLVFVGVLGLIVYTVLRLARGVRGEQQKAAGDQSGVEGGGIILIGPIPIVFGSNRRIAKWMLLAALAITILLVVETLLALGLL